MSEEKDPVLTLERILEQWPHMAGNGEHVWLNHLLGYDVFEMMHIEADPSSTEGVNGLYYWTVQYSTVEKDTAEALAQDRLRLLRSWMLPTCTQVENDWGRPLFISCLKYCRVVFSPAWKSLVAVE